MSPSPAPRFRAVLFSCANLLVIAITAVPLAAQHPYRIVDLGVLPGEHGSVGRGITPDGRKIVGWSGQLPFVWEEGVGMKPLALPPGMTNAAPRDIDAQGRIVGSGGYERAVLWKADGSAHDLGALGGNGRTSYATAINAAGLVVGATELLPNTTFWHAFVWQDGVGMNDLTPTQGETWATDINDFGQVCGYASFSAWRLPQGGAIQYLGQPTGFAFSTAFAINDAGQVCGSATSASGNTQRIVRYRDGAGWEVLGGLGQQAMGSGINSFGQVVGTTDSTPRAFVYTDGLGLQDVAGLIDPALGWFPLQTYAINDRGQVSGHGFFNPAAQTHAFRLDPIYVTTYGSGCDGAGARQPKLLVAGLPQGGQTIVILAAEGVRRGTAVLVLSAGPASVPLPGGCTALVAAPALAMVPIALDDAGQAAVKVTLPVGLPAGLLWLQLASLDAAAPNGLFSLSNGVRVQTL